MYMYMCMYTYIYIYIYIHPPWWGIGCAYISQPAIRKTYATVC